MKRIGLIFMAIALVSSFTACSFSGGEHDEAEAEKLAETYLTAVHQGEYEKAFSMTNKDFFGTRPKADWEAFFKKVDERMGKLEKMTLKRKTADSRYSGKFFVYQFASKYENGYAQEMVTMIEKINTNEPLSISGHKIESSLLPREE